MHDITARRDLAGSLTQTLRRAAAHERLAVLCSFQKEESVILDELVALAPHVLRSDFVLSLVLVGPPLPFLPTGTAVTAAPPA